MNSYNGFSASQRAAAQRWLNGEYAAGRRIRPTVCDACGQTRGLIQAHAEDYSGPPYGDTIDQFALCFRCHMMIHCRFRNPWTFERYVQSLEIGQFWPATGSWPKIQKMLAGPEEDPVLGERTAGDPGLLRAMALGAYRPPQAPEHS